MNDILGGLWYILPAYLANTAPVFAGLILGNRLAAPVDFGKKLWDKPLLGRNKTYRGIVAAVIVGSMAAFFQSLFYSHDAIQSISYYDYSSPLLFGAVMGFGAIMGDLVKSLIKRRLDRSPGQSWKPFDQIDFIIGGLAAGSFIQPPSLLGGLSALFLVPIIKVILDHAAFYLGINKSRW